MNNVSMVMVYRLNIALTILGELEDRLHGHGRGVMSVTEY